MAINPEEIDVTTVDKLDTLTLAIGNFFAHTNLNGKLGKATIAQLATFVAPYVTAVGGSGFVATTGTVLPAASVGKFTIVGPGTFTQTTGGSITTTEFFNILGSNATTWSLVTAIPVPSSLVLKDNTQYKGTFDTLALALSGIPSAQRKVGDTVGIRENGNVVNYWWEELTTNAGLVLKIDDLMPWKPKTHSKGQRAVHVGMAWEAVRATTALEEPGVVAETIWKKLLWRVNVSRVQPTVMEGDLKRDALNNIFVAKKSSSTELPTTDITAFNQLRTSSRNLINKEGYYGK